MSNIAIQLKSMGINKNQPILPKELLAICISHDSTTKYYSTLGKKTGWRSYETMALKTMLSRLNPSIQDTTPEHLLKNSPRNLDGVFRHPIKNNNEPGLSSNKNKKELIIISVHENNPIWTGIIINNTLFLRGNGLEPVSSLEYGSLKESIVAVIELAEESLDCDTLVICLDRNDKNSCQHLSTLIRSLMYFGFEPVPPNTYNHSNEFILVGMEL